MPVVSVKLWDLARLIGVQISQESLSETLRNLKLEVEKLEADTLTYEAPHDRVDLYSVEGLARAVSYQIGAKKPAKYPVLRSDVYIDSREAPSYRPYVMMTIVRGVRLDDEAISQLFQLQEKVHLTHCGNRELISIGLYDLDTLRFPVYYRAVSSIEFRPLGYGRAMNVRQILTETDKGQEYGSLVREGHYPLLVDSRGTVLSLPPIINSEDTKITEKTRNILLDVTGVEPRLMAQMLAIMTTAAYERGAERIEVVPVRGGAVSEEIVRDILLGRNLRVNSVRISELIGMQVDLKDVLVYVERYGYVVESANENGVTVWVPPYRADVIDEDDVIEDIAISVDYNRITGRIEPPTGRGIVHPIETVSKYLRDALVGLGFTEILNFILSDPDYLNMLGYAVFAEVKNPKMRAFSALRPSLMPGVLKSLSKNVKKYGFQNVKVFEIGDVIDPKALTTLRKASGALYGLGVTLTDGLAVIRTLFEVFSLKPSFGGVEYTGPTIVERSASIKVDGIELGVLGEVHPKYLRYLELLAPVTIFEISIDRLAELLGLSSEIPRVNLFRAY